MNLDGRATLRCMSRGSTENSDASSRAPSLAGMHAQNRGKQVPTLEQVAARAGVSRATASRVLRGSQVSQASRDAVTEAATALAYSPNRAARSLVTGRSDSIAFLVAETEDRMFSDPFFLGMLRSTQAALAAAGQQLVFTMASSEAEQARFVHYAAAGHVDGVLLLSLHAGDSLACKLEAAGIPTMLAGRPLSSTDSLYYVDSDNVAGARMATELLIARGCRRIAFIGGPTDMSVGLDRRQGFRDAMSAEPAGEALAKRGQLVATGDFTVAGGARAMRELLAREPALDGVFAASDLMALGALHVLQASNRTVPQDVALIGFDDVADAALAHPSLSTVRQPIAALGRTMSERLLARIAGADPPRSSVLPVELVRRQSA